MTTTTKHRLRSWTSPLQNFDFSLSFFFIQILRFALVRLLVFEHFNQNALGRQLELPPTQCELLKNISWYGFNPKWMERLRIWKPSKVYKLTMNTPAICQPNRRQSTSSGILERNNVAAFHWNRRCDGANAATWMPADDYCTHTFHAVSQTGWMCHMRPICWRWLCHLRWIKLLLHTHMHREKEISTMRALRGCCACLYLGDNGVASICSRWNCRTKSTISELFRRYADRTTHRICDLNRHVCGAI